VLIVRFQAAYNIHGAVQTMTFAGFLMIENVLGWVRCPACRWLSQMPDSTLALVMALIAKGAPVDGGKNDLIVNTEQFQTLYTMAFWKRKAWCCVM